MSRKWLMVKRTVPTKVKYIVGYGCCGNEMERKKSDVKYLYIFTGNKLYNSAAHTYEEC